MCWACLNGHIVSPNKIMGSKEGRPWKLGMKLHSWPQLKSSFWVSQYNHNSRNLFICINRYVFQKVNKVINSTKTLFPCQISENPPSVTLFPSKTHIYSFYSPIALFLQETSNSYEIRIQIIPFSSKQPDFVHSRALPHTSEL